MADKMTPASGDFPSSKSIICPDCGGSGKEKLYGWLTYKTCDRCHGIGRFFAMDCVKPQDSAESWAPVKWALSDPQFDEWFICVVNGRAGRKYVVRHGPYCLNSRAMLEYEPLPSSRDDAFLKRTRLDSFEEAVARFEKFKKRQSENKELYYD